jgi:hypothetical protein
MDRISDEGKHTDRGSAEPAAEAVVLVVHRTGMVMVVRVGARLVRWMGEDLPTGIVRGAGLALSCAVLEKLVEPWRRGQGEIEHRE